MMKPEEHPFFKFALNIKVLLLRQDGLLVVGLFTLTILYVAQNILTFSPLLYQNSSGALSFEQLSQVLTNKFPVHCRNG